VVGGDQQLVTGAVVTAVRAGWWCRGPVGGRVGDGTVRQDGREVAEGGDQPEFRVVGGTEQECVSR
jgi:hypothetical protein